MTAVWWDLLTGKPWVTPAIFELAVRLVLIEVEQYMPTIATFMSYCQDAKRNLERYEAPRPALPAPVAPQTDDTTPEERSAAMRAKMPEMIAAARKAARIRLDGIAATRAAAGFDKAAGGLVRHTVQVRWADGQESTVTLISDDNARKAKAWLDQHPATQTTAGPAYREEAK